MTIHKTVPRNTRGRDFIIGDLHGCWEELEVALEVVNFDHTVDRLFSTGDLIDRGPDSDRCLDLVQEPWFFMVQGNHEQMAIDSVLKGGRGISLWYSNGGSWWENQIMPDAYREDLEFIQKFVPLSLTIETAFGNIGVSHAEPPLDWDDLGDGNLGMYGKESLTWGRRRIKYGGSPVANIGMTIHGHTPVHQPVKVANTLFIDTGCVYEGGKLTLLCLDTILKDFNQHPDGIYYGKG